MKHEGCFFGLKGFCQNGVIVKTSKGIGLSEGLLLGTSVEDSFMEEWQPG